MSNSVIIKNANSPFMGEFKVSQAYTPGVHDGLDLVALGTDKNVHSCSTGTVIWADWENVNDHSQGFGKYVAVQDDAVNTDGIHQVRYYGHLNSIAVKLGPKVSCTDILGEMGSTGRSTGAHCHYEIRSAHYKGAKVYDVSKISGIPNVENGIYDDGYRPGSAVTASSQASTTVSLGNKKYKITITET